MLAGLRTGPRIQDQKIKIQVNTASRGRGKSVARSGSWAGKSVFPGGTPLHLQILTCNPSSEACNAPACAQCRSGPVVPFKHRGHNSSWQETVAAADTITSPASLSAVAPKSTDRRMISEHRTEHHPGNPHQCCVVASQLGWQRHIIYVWCPLTFRLPVR
jgi:hypothetical protein